MRTPPVTASAMDVVDPVLRCPNCSGAVVVSERVVRCVAGHSFDRSRSGHVNLLIGGRLARQGDKAAPGDSREMLVARQRFFDGGHYRPLMDRLAALATGAERVVDIGCGVGSYLAHLAAPRRYGFDVAKT
ncbi:MAG TPA: hypothetical protein PLV68_19920, partial [Ilumatobacteraceae bacterium]|nr:hypothetical protein [Ilumatobacteraceae bacterium]